MASRRTLIAGNWKMNGLAADGSALASALAARMQEAGVVSFDLLLCPPATLVSRITDAVAGTPVLVGGQDCHAKVSGAHTGDVSAAMLKDAGAAYVIVGHSERRQDHAESDDQVAAKAAAVHAAGLIAIICVGETRDQRVAGDANIVVSRQLAGSLPAGATAANTVIAYEPVWAIGTGLTPTTADVADMHRHIRAELQGKVDDAEGVRLLYGGSVKAANAAELLAVTNVDGALVGGASLTAHEFWAIATAATACG